MALRKPSPASLARYVRKSGETKDDRRQFTRVTVSAKRPQIVWLKRDLRFADHAPLYSAAKTGAAVVILYVVEPDYWNLPDVSRRHWHFIHDCLHSLRKTLADMGQNLIVRTGSITDVLKDFREKIGPFDLHSHEETGNDWTFRRDRRVAAWCRANGMVWREYPSHGVVRALADRD